MNNLGTVQMNDGNYLTKGDIGDLGNLGRQGTVSDSISGSFDMASVIPGSLSLKDENGDTFVLTPKVLQRILELVKKEYPEDEL